MKTLGQTGLSVSPIGLGLAALGRPGYINLGHADDLQQNYDVDAMRQHTHAMLDAAWAAGVRYFDAARSYGKAEDFLGSWLRARGIGPHAVTVGSKWGYTYTADWQVAADKHEVKEHSLRVLNRQWGETQSFLSDYLDLYQIHSATFSSGVLENDAVLQRLGELKAEGTAIGLSLSGPKQAEVLLAALDVQTNGQLLFDTVQVTWNPLEPSTSDVLKQAAAAGVGIIVKEALANGRLTPRNNDPTFADKMHVLQAQAKRLHTTVDALVMAYILAQPWVSVVLSGAARLDHLHANLKALDVVLDEETTSALDALAEAPETYWQTRSNLDWN